MIDMDEITRELKKHKVIDVVRATGLHRNTVSKIRLGKRPPQLETLNAILQFLSANKSATE